MIKGDKKSYFLPKRKEGKSLMVYDYFKYCLEHKINVFKVCWNKGQYLHAITHDLSKFTPKEFCPYAKYFYGKWGAKLLKEYGAESLSHGESCYSRYYLKAKQDFDKAWEHHYLHNKHHWNHWCYDVKSYLKSTKELKDFKLNTPRPMPLKYIMQMISDWEAMSLKLGGTAQAFYLKNYTKIELHHRTRFLLEVKLNLTNETDRELELHSIEEIIRQAHFDKVRLDKIFESVNAKYNLNIYDLVAPQLLNKESDNNGRSET